MAVTDTAHWGAIAQAEPSPHWDARSQMVAYLIRPGDRVMDLGAADQKLRNHLPENCPYIAVDCVDKRLPIPTFVVDFNQEFRLPNTEADVIVCAGITEYLDDPAGFMRQLAIARHGTHVIVTYSLPRSRTIKPPRRNHHGSPKACWDCFAPYIAHLRMPICLPKQVVLTGVLGAVEPAAFPRHRKPLNALAATGFLARLRAAAAN